MKKTCLLALFALVTFCGGCATVSPRVTSGIRINPEAVSDIQPGVTTRAELIRQFRQCFLGTPQWTWDAERAIAYTWTTSNGATARWYGKILSVQQTDWALGIVFDSSDRVVRYDFFKSSSSPEKTREAVEAWIHAKS